MNEHNNLQLTRITVEPYFISLWFNLVDFIAYGNQVDHMGLILLLDYYFTRQNENSADNDGHDNADYWD